MNVSTRFIAHGMEIQQHLRFKINFMEVSKMKETNYYLTVGELLEKLKDVPKDYVVLVPSDNCQMNYGMGVDVDDKNKEVEIYEYC